MGAGCSWQRHLISALSCLPPTSGCVAASAGLHTAACVEASAGSACTELLAGEAELEISVDDRKASRVDAAAICTMTLTGHGGLAISGSHHLGACPTELWGMKEAFERLVHHYNDQSQVMYERDGTVPMLAMDSQLCLNGLASVMSERRSAIALLRQLLAETMRRVVSRGIARLEGNPSDKLLPLVQEAGVCWFCLVPCWQGYLHFGTGPQRW
jgi:hypothetical protein